MNKLIHHFLTPCLLALVLCCGESGGESSSSSTGPLCQPPTENLEDCAIPLPNFGDSLKQVRNDTVSILCESRCTRIDGDLLVGRVRGLKDLSLLRNVRTVAGHIDVIENPDLESLEGLEEIQMTDPNDKSVSIHYNPKLRNTKGLGGIKNMDSLYIQYNERLESIDETDHITELKYLIISDSQAMKVLEGFDNLTKVETFEGKSMSRNGRFSILSMTQLEEIRGFGKLKDAARLSLYNNPKLTSLEAFDTLGGPMIALRIRENTGLSTCAAQELAKRFTDLKLTEIEDNKPCP